MGNFSLRFVAGVCVRGAEMSPAFVGVRLHVPRLDSVHVSWTSLKTEGEAFVACDVLENVKNDVFYRVGVLDCGGRY